MLYRDKFLHHCPSVKFLPTKCFDKYYVLIIAQHFDCYSKGLCYVYYYVTNDGQDVTEKTFTVRFTDADLLSQNVSQLPLLSVCECSKTLYIT